MIILNFTHPFTDSQKEQIEQLTNQSITAVHTIPTHLDNNQPFPPQIQTLLDSVELTPEQWQTAPLLINPPAYAPAAATLLAELHGRIGHFPTIIRIRPIPESVPTQYEVAELINLQAIRETTRKQRLASGKNHQSSIQNRKS